MPSQSDSRSKLRTASRWAVISLVLFATTWLAVVMWWQTTQRIVSTAEATLYLLVLPLCALLGIGLWRWRASRTADAPSPPPGTEASGSLGSGSVANGAAKATARPPQLPILGSWAATGLGLDSDRFIEALSAQRTRPTPDEYLLDDDGFPLLSCRAKDLDMSAVRQELSRAIATGMLDNAPAPEEWRDAPLRALALLQSVLDAVLHDWPLSATSGNKATPDMALPILRGSSGIDEPVRRRFDMQVKLLVSASLAAHESQFIQACIADRLKTTPLAEHRFKLELHASDDDATALTLARDFCATAMGNDVPQALLLLAGDSTLCPSVVEDWASRNQLFDPRHPHGLMMGEAAFALLFANEKTLQATSAEPVCHLTHVSRASREASADVPVKASHTCLAETIEAALKTTGLGSDAISMVVCDADHRASRTLECIGAMASQTPQLDAIENRFAINETCGHLGAASVSGLLAAGAMQVHLTGHPVLLFNVSHAVDRAAAVVLHANGDHAAAHTSRSQAA